MNRGLIVKTLRETWLAITIFALAIFVFEVVMIIVLASFHEQLTYLLDVSFIQNILKGIVGTEMGDEASPDAITAIPWVHPLVLSIIWAHEIIFCTRLPAGEVDRGTIDVLLGLPVSRWQVYLSDTAIWLVSGMLIVALGLLGNRWGSLSIEAEFRPELQRVVPAAVNLYCLYIAVGGLAFLISSLCDRRGRAISIVFGIVVVSYFLNFIAQIWEPAQNFSFLSVMHYHRPVFILRDGTWPISDMLVLVLLGALLWTLGGLIFSRRDICTV